MAPVGRLAEQGACALAGRPDSSSGVRHQRPQSPGLLGRRRTAALGDRAPTGRPADGGAGTPARAWRCSPTAVQLQRPRREPPAPGRRGRARGRTHHQPAGSPARCGAAPPPPGRSAHGLVGASASKSSHRTWPRWNSERHPSSPSGSSASSSSARASRSVRTCRGRDAASARSHHLAQQVWSPVRRGPARPTAA